MAKQKKAESRVPKHAKALLKKIAVCRHPDCPVATHHPFYWSEETIGPVVPTYLRTGNVMVIAAYPTAMFVNFRSAKHVPYYDVSEPLADNRYYDGTGVRDVKAGTYFDKAYLSPLGFKKDDLWITNTVKCFLFDKKQAKRHRELPLIKPIRILPTREDFFGCARPCVETHLIKEVEICRPKLIISLGSEAAEAIHGTFGITKKKPAELGGRFNFKAVLGVPLPANKRLDKKDRKGCCYDKREGIFFRTNIFHLIHPGYLMRIPYGEMSKEHWSKNLPAAFDFIKELGIRQAKVIFETKDDMLKKELADLEKNSKHEVDHGDDRVTV
ncbi:MAG: uracil-DNA glycosylase family protein [bacterium]